MSGLLRWMLVTVLGVHGLIHFLGAGAGFGWTDSATFTEPIGILGAFAWSVAGVLVLAAAAAVALGVPSWRWAVAGAAALGSQLVIFTSWSDARAGSAANLVLLLVAGYGFASHGPTSLERRWLRHAQAALEASADGGELLSEADLVDLPVQVARYVERSGAVGRPKVRNFFATMHGRIRSGPDAPWMPFTSRQLNTFGPLPRRLFLMQATMNRLPVTVLHVFDERGASMRGRAVSLVPVLDAAGPEMDRSETVTLFNDLVVFAPGALASAPVEWTVLDHDRVRARFTRGGHTVTADLVFDADGDLVDFVSDDRSRAAEDGKSFTRQRWRTPLTGYRDLRGRDVAGSGDARWYADAPEGPFAYIEFTVDDLAHDVTSPRLPMARPDGKAVAGTRG